MSKYRCPGCSVLYCSLACNRVHKSGEGGGKPACTGKRPQPATAINGHGPAQGSYITSSSQQSSGKRPRSDGCVGDGVVQSPPSQACVRMGRDQWRGGREDKEEEEWRISADQRARMARCAWLKAALRDPKLQALLVRGVICVIFFQNLIFSHSTPATALLIGLE